MAISPLIFSVIYDEVGNVRGQEMLVSQQRIQCIDPVLFRSHFEVDWRTPLPTWLNVMELILSGTVSNCQCTFFSGQFDGV